MNSKIVEFCTAFKLQFVQTQQLTQSEAIHLALQRNRPTWVVHEFPYFYKPFRATRSFPGIFRPDQIYYYLGHTFWLIEDKSYLKLTEMTDLTVTARKKIIIQAIETLKSLKRLGLSGIGLHPFSIRIYEDSLGLSIKLKDINFISPFRPEILDRYNLVRLTIWLFYGIWPEFENYQELWQTIEQLNIPLDADCKKFISEVIEGKTPYKNLEQNSWLNKEIRFQQKLKNEYLMSLSQLKSFNLPIEPKTCSIPNQVNLKMTSISHVAPCNLTSKKSKKWYLRIGGCLRKLFR